MEGNRKIRVVLCRPEGAFNVGAVCRAMKTMGLSELFIIGEPESFKREEVLTMAIHAMDIYDNVRWFTSLKEALDDCVLSAGITRRQGSRRKMISYTPEEFAEKISRIKNGTAAIVFGNEQNGLSGEELSFCRTAVHIPSHPNFPSLNLSHAVQVISYVLYCHGDSGQPKLNPVPQKEIDRLSITIGESLGSLGLFDKEDRFGTIPFFREILSRAQLCEKETAHLEKIFKKIRYTAKGTNCDLS